MVIVSIIVVIQRLWAKTVGPASVELADGVRKWLLPVLLVGTIRYVFSHHVYVCVSRREVIVPLEHDKTSSVIPPLILPLPTATLKKTS
eukprot:scaffold2510_cov169-Amphora_coffeaeformis.AAC.5